MNVKRDSTARPWVLYLLECVDGSYYAGITTDLARRFEQHRLGTGARYTRSHPPLRVIAYSSYPDRGRALRAEYALKQLPKTAKPAFFNTDLCGSINVPRQTESHY